MNILTVHIGKEVGKEWIVNKGLVDEFTAPLNYTMNLESIADDETRNRYENLRNWFYAVDDKKKPINKIQAYIKSDKEIKIEAQKKAKDVRNELLQKGTLTKDKRIWFNIETAQMFVSKVTTIEDGETMLWKDANREIITLTKDEARAYSKEIVDVLDVVYGLKPSIGGA